MTDLELPPLPPAKPSPPPVDPSQPAAGGWTPTPLQRALGVGLVSTLGALAPSLLAALPGRPGVIAAAVCGALALGIAAALGMASAGPRRLL